jgi:hypothetical protein
MQTVVVAAHMLIVAAGLVLLLQVLLQVCWRDVTAAA